MKDKYLKFFKGELFFLLILLVVVCFSFGATYSNFIYNSDSYRAVEMFSGKLKYELNENRLLVKPGNNLFKINIKSLNNVDSYYKIIYSNDMIDTSYYNNNSSNIIKANESIFVNLLIFNKSNENILVDIDCVGGFVTNTYEDVIVDNNYKYVSSNINVGYNVVLNDENFTLLNVNNDGSYDLLSQKKNDILNIEGSHGYNQYIDIINTNIDEYNDIDIIRVLSLEDIEKYTKNKIVTYGSLNYFSSAYYPVLWGVEEGSIINDNPVESLYSKSEGTKEGNYEFASSITLKDIEINNAFVFVNKKYEEIFFDSNYLLSTRYQKASNNAEWGILSIEDGNIKLNKLFDSKMNDYRVKGNIRLFVKLSKNVNIIN